jgi:predicted RNA-binding Zn-ribbon protein involved in translation (DUF1610 family)
LSVLRDVLRSIRRGSQGVLFCPKCGGAVRSSREPGRGYGLTPQALDGWVLPTKYVCNKCGYSGFIALEEEAEIETRESR